MCDLAYVLLIEQRERQVAADRQLVATMNASGRYEHVSLPEFGAERDKLDAALVADPADRDAAPAGVDAEQWELRQALGVA